MIQRRSPIKRSALPARTKRVCPKRETPRRVSVMRDPEYLAFLRERSCVACIIERDEATRWERLPKAMPCVSDPAHGPVNGRGSKGPDDGAISLCRSHHSEQHKLGWEAFQKKYGFDRQKEAIALYATYLIATGKLA